MEKTSSEESSILRRYPLLQAVELSGSHNLAQVNSMLGRYVADLTGSNERTLAAVQLYRRAGRHLDAARIIFDVRIVSSFSFIFGKFLRLRATKNTRPLHY